MTRFSVRFHMRKAPKMQPLRRQLIDRWRGLDRNQFAIWAWRKRMRTPRPWMKDTAP